MVVREINSQNAKAGDRYKLRVDSPVLMEGRVAIPVGSFATAEVVAVNGTSAAGGKGQLSFRLISVDTQWGPVALAGTNGVEGANNTGGVVLSVLGFGLLGLLNKGGNAVFKAGDIIVGRIDEGEATATQPLVIGP